MKITALHIYPVKSMRGLSVERAQAQLQGFAGDREWLLTDENGRYFTAREVEDTLRWHCQPLTGADGSGIRLVAPDGRTHEARADDYRCEGEVSVWADERFIAYGGPAATDAWLSARFQRPCRLFYLGPTAQRKFPLNGGGPQSFSDGAPYLITTEASLAELNSQLDVPVSMARFRTNIVVDGLHAWDEDNWQRLRIGAIEFSGYKPCQRCKIVNLDPLTAALSPDLEPLKTLAKIHRLPSGACFGVNYYAHGSGMLQVGDEVQVLS